MDAIKLLDLFAVGCREVEHCIFYSADCESQHPLNGWPMILASWDAHSGAWRVFPILNLSWDDDAYSKGGSLNWSAILY
jgi:hypothetical protein